MNTLREKAIFATYAAAGRLISPFLRLMFAKRARSGRDDAKLIRQRFGGALSPRPAGPLVWFHSARFNDIRSLAPLVNLIDAHGVSSLVTASSLTALRAGRRLMPESAIVQYAPLDTPGAVRKFLDHWTPDLSITSGSELWPLAASELSERNIDRLIVSAALSDDATAFWEKRKALGTPIFHGLTHVMARTEDDAQKFRNLGAHSVEVTGDLQHDISLMTDADDEAATVIRKAIGKRPVWTAAYVSEAECKAIGKAQKQIKKEVAGSLCLLVPERPYLSGDIAQTLESSGLKIGIQSRGDTPIDATDVFIMDDCSNIAIAFELASVAFFGGSLANKGGQCPVDGVLHRCAIVAGQDVHRHPDIYATLHLKGGAHFVADDEGLANFVSFALAKKPHCDAMCDAASLALEETRGSLEKTYLELDAYLRPLCYQARMDMTPALKPAVQQNNKPTDENPAEIAAE